MPGPYVQVAAIVDTVLHEKDDVISLIRLTDRLNIELKAPEPHNLPDELPEGTINITLVVMLKSGDARGRARLSVQPQMPSGQDLEEMSTDVLFEGGEERGVNVFVTVSMPAVEGLYWIPVRIDGRELTRVPYRVAYRRAR